MATAPAPFGTPKSSSSVFAYVTDCFDERKRLREMTLPPALGRNSRITLALCSPALSTVSSVRQAVPPTPLLCVVTETSERWAVCAATDTCREDVAELVAFDAVRVTLYVPGAAKVITGFRAVDVRPSPNDHDQLVGAPLERSAKVTFAPTVGAAGAKSKSAATGGVAGAGFLTVIVFVC